MFRSLFGGLRDNTRSARVDFSLYVDGPDKNRMERSTMWASQNSQRVVDSEANLKRLQFQQQLIDMGQPHLAWTRRYGILCSGCLPCSWAEDWVVSLSRGEQQQQQQRISITVEPTFNITNCIFSLGILYPCCLVMDADGIEISLERVGDRVFFSVRRKHFCLERAVLELTEVTEVKLQDTYDPNGEEGEDGVQVNLLIEHGKGSTVYSLPHAYRKSFFVFFTEFQAIARDIINGIAPINITNSNNNITNNNNNTNNSSQLITNR